MDLLIFLLLAITCNSPGFLSVSGMIPDKNSSNSSGTAYPFAVGVILDTRSPVGRTAYNCISMAVSEFYAMNGHYQTRLVLHTRDSMGEPLHALSAAIDLLENTKVQAIMGPQTSEEAEFLVDLGDKARVPILTFSVTSSFFSQVKTPYFFRVAANDNAQVKAIAAIVQAFKWKQVILLHEDTVYGNGVIPYLISALTEIASQVPYRSAIPTRANDEQIVIQLQRLMTMPTRVFVVHMSSVLGSRIFLKAKELGMISDGYAWIVTHGITSTLNSLDSLVIESMEGVIGLRPHIPPSKELKDFTLKRQSKTLNITEGDDGNIFCLWAYDAVWALGKAAEKVGTKASKPKNPKSSSSKSTCLLDSIPISETGPELVTTILESKFQGLSGKFQFTGGEVQTFAFQIVNIIGKKAKGIGFWTQEHGISKVLNVPNNRNNMYSAPMTDIEQIVWPGGSKVTPKGWVMPVSGKNLRIGFPANEGFPELVKSEKDHQTGAITMSGFCIDVFQAAVAMLPYALPYEFIPWLPTNGTYNDLIFQVYSQVFDAVVGDVTITANRSQYVDFTLPYTEFGVGMVVPIETGKTENMWIFLEPLTVDLWLVIGVLLTVTGCIVWVIEHKNNEEFKGSTAQQVGVVFWYSFSTLVFAQRERLRSNLSKFVVIVWLFAVLILTSTYTASLSSLLTVDRLQVLQKGSYIGYQDGSPNKFFSNLNFDNSSIRPYASIEDYADALTRGSKEGGVSAVIDEIPYIKLFLAKYRDRYTVIEPTYSNTNGFAFAFPKGSPLVPDISAAIAKLREDGILYSLELKWFGDHSIFKKQESQAKPRSLNSYSFRGLFLITGISSTLGLAIFCVLLVKDKVTSSEEQPQLNNGMAQEPSDHPTDSNISIEGEENSHFSSVIDDTEQPS